MIKTNFEDILNQTIGYLRVDKYIGGTNGHHFYECTCLYNNCGKTTRVLRCNLLRGKSKSCGCYRKKVTSDRQSIENPNDILGKQYGFLVVNKYLGRNKGHLYECKCLNTMDGKTCNKVFVAERNHIISGHTKSCGCLASNQLKTHGLYNHPLYHIYQSMKSRCTNTHDKSYFDYGGRGIKICKEWIGEEDGLQNFILDMYASYLKFKSKHPDVIISLDRKEVNGDYSKENCRWATPIMQAGNRRSTVYYNYKGNKYTTRELIEKFCNNKISIVCLRARLKKEYFCKGNTIINPRIFEANYYNRAKG